MQQIRDPYQDPVQDRTRKLAAVLGKEVTGRILAVLAHESYLSASDIASRLHIHIATAQKYLMEMKEAGLVNSRWRRSPTRPTEEYWLSKDKITIEIDLRSDVGRKDMESLANSLTLSLRRDVNVAIDSDDSKKMVSEILVLGDGDRPIIGNRIKLDNVEGRFAWHLAEEPTNVRVMDVVEKAELDSKYLPQIMDLVDKLTNIGAVRSTTHEKKEDE